MKQAHKSACDPNDDAVESPCEPQLRLERFLPHQLSVLSNLISRAISREYAERFGLSIPEWRAIAVLQHFPGISSGELSAKSGMDYVAVSRAVSRLERAELVTRNMSVTDRRRTVLNLSDRGRRIYREITPLALRYEGRLVDGLGSGDRDELDRLLTKLLEQAQQLHDER